MPRVRFVNEDRVVEIEKGKLISDVAAELGIAVCREHFAGTGFGDYTVWVKGAPDSVSPAGFFERLRGARGQKRFANRARILGDCEVTTQAGLANRLRSPRPIAPPPRPTEDPSLLKAEDASGTAAFPYGHPSMVGCGTRTELARGASEKSDAKQAAAAAAVAKTAAAGQAPAAAGDEGGAAAPAAAAPEDAAAAKAARIAEKKARQAALKAKLAGGDAPAAEAPVADVPAEASPIAEAVPAPAPEPTAAVEGKPPMDPEKAARIAEKKARQAALKARLTSSDPVSTEPPAAPTPPAAEAPAEAKPSDEKSE